MQRNLTKAIMLAIPLFLSSMSLLAQGWEKAYGGQFGDGLYDVLSTPDGGFLSVGHKQISASPLQHNLYLVKTDASGFVDWSQEISDTMYSYFGKSIYSTDDGGYIIGGTAVTDDIPRGFLAKTNNLGNLEWLKRSDQDSVWGVKALQLNNGNYILAGTVFGQQSANGMGHDFYQMTVNSTGDSILHADHYGGPLYDDCRDMVETPQGDLLMVGFTNSQGAGQYDAFLLKINTDGDSIWAKPLGSADAERAYGIAATNDGNFVIAGQIETITLNNNDIFLSKIDTQGDPIWWKSYPKDGLDLAYDVKQAAIGGYILTGYTQQNTQSDRQAFLLKTYINGDEHWKKHFGGVNHDGGFSVENAANFGYVVAGYTHSYGAGGADGYLLRTDNSGIANSCFIVGNVHSNDNSSCIPEEFGQYIENAIVEVEGNTTYFGTTDENGNYSIPVPSGNYNVRMVNPSPYWELCEDSVDVSLSGSFDTAFVNYSLHPDTSCAYMRVDLSTLSMRRCFQNAYTVSYCNLGTLEANPAEIEVTFDPYLIIDSTSVPWSSQVGSTYTFDVGYLDPFECGSFNVYFTVDCDSTVLGQTHCSEAHVSPNQLCIDPDPQWDEASIELYASCDGDSVFFTIINIGQGDMVDPLGFIVIEDLIMGLQGNFTLNSGEDTTITLPAKGSTLRLEADQSYGHPGNSKPCISVEGCGGATYNYNTGYVIQYPLNDADPFVDTDCRENTGSFDPNDKTGFPMGYGQKHFIEANTDIEYLIRFQNTGTDTAFTVVIRDTLSPHLDPTSIEVGGSSHPMRYELYGNGILKFVFDEIMLPDSNVNEPASHGFVKFRIKQQRDLPNGMVIENSAAIYFDFNEPIITNTTDHTIGENFIEVNPLNVTNLGSETLPWVNVYPNPFVKEATFELKNVEGNAFVFHLMDVNGNLVTASNFRGKSFQFDRGNLPSGVYFFSILYQGQSFSSGKIVLR